MEEYGGYFILGWWPLSVFMIIGSVIALRIYLKGKKEDDSIRENWKEADKKKLSESYKYFKEELQKYCRNYNMEPTPGAFRKLQAMVRLDLMMYHHIRTYYDSNFENSEGYLLMVVWIMEYDPVTLKKLKPS